MALLRDENKVQWVNKLKAAKDWVAFEERYQANNGHNMPGVRRARREVAKLEDGPHWVAESKAWKGKAFTADDYRKLVRVAKERPQLVGEDVVADQRLWFFRGKFVSSERDLDADDVFALLMEKENRKRLRLEKAHALQAMRRTLDEKAKRQPIPQEVKVAVWQRDAGRCVECGSNEELEYDHIIPVAMGGSNTERNLQLLCAVCNRRKGATLG